jgi:hypothetical protein
MIPNSPMQITLLSIIKRVINKETLKYYAVLFHIYTQRPAFKIKALEAKQYINI